MGCPQMADPVRCPHCRKTVADVNALYQHVKVKHRGPIKQGKHKRPFRQPRESDSIASELVDALQSGERPAHLAAMFPEEFHG